GIVTPELHYHFDQRGLEVSVEMHFALLLAEFAAFDCVLVVLNVRSENYSLVASIYRIYLWLCAGRRVELRVLRTRGARGRLRDGIRRLGGGRCRGYCGNTS